MSTKMRALVLKSYNSDFTDSQVDKPFPKEGEVLVKIIASGVNPIDNKIRIEKAPYATPVLPAVLGTDLAGIIEAVGENVSKFKVGDEVYGLAGGVLGLQGTLAEYTAVDADLLAIKPKNLTMREAAAVPLTVLTAWEGLADRFTIKEGDKVLVQGGTGGVGHMAVQLAKIFGAEVFATASPSKIATVEALGAKGIDYTTAKVEDYVAEFTNGKGFDVIYDTVGGAVLDNSFKAIRHYGHISSCAAFGTHNLATGSLRSNSLHGIFVLLPMLTGEGRKHHGEILKKVTQYIEDGKLKPIIDPRKFTLDNALEAHIAVSDGSGNTKIVVDIL